MTTLFERWDEVARSNRDEIALRDLTTGEKWTFGELASAAEGGMSSNSGFCFPQGNTSDFVLSVLRAWRLGEVVCPLEAEQGRPDISLNFPREIIHLKTTSATTGAPRLVAFTASQLMADARNIVSTMGLRPAWPNLGVISLAHSYGFSNLVLPLLLHGIPLILSGSSLPEAVRRASETADSLTLPGVPALWRVWHEADSVPKNVRLAISAGAPLPVQLEKEVFVQRGLKIHNFYGSSECGGIAYDRSTKPREDSACAGSAMDNVGVTISVEGCIEVRSGAVAENYWPEQSPNLGNRVFRTSDLGEINDGKIYLRGRAGDQINVAGRKIAPETIERVLRTHPEVRECLAFGVPSADAGRGETIVACLAANGSLTPEELRRFIGKQLPAWQVPREWWFVDLIEANQRGKLSRAEWRKRYLERKT